MAKNKLTILACSGSILAATLFADPSHAMPQQNFGDSNRQVLDGVSLPENRVNTPQSTEDSLSPKFGCGCTNCVTAVRKLVRSGELSV